MGTNYRKYENCLDRNSYNMLFYMVGTAGFEPATHGLKGQGCPITGNKRAMNATIKTGGYALALFPVAS